MKEGDLVILVQNIRKFNLRKGDVGVVVNVSHQSDLLNVQFASKDGLDEVEVVLEFKSVAPYVEKNYDKKDKDVMHKYLMNQLEEIFMNIDNYKIRDYVDEKGIDSLINQSARFAATSGAIMGAFGPIALLGLPVDIINNITQQFRITLGIIYEKTGTFKPSFESFIRIVAVSLGIEVGATITKLVLIQISKQILLRIGIGGVGRLIPVFGAVIGGGVNYKFITTIGQTLKSMRID